VISGTFKFTKYILLLLAVVLIAACRSASPSTIPRGMHKRKVFNDTAQYPWFAARYSQYNPKQEVIDRLNTLRLNRNFEIIVFAGTWCSDTKILLPKFYKTIDALKHPPKVTLILVDKEKKSGKEIEKDYGLEYVPTFIVEEHKRETGRIVEVTQKSIEEDLAEIIMGK